jgi:predicted esterase
MLTALAFSFTSPARSDSETQKTSFEPAQRELWTRGSERFQRQWLIAGPIEAAVAGSIDAASLQPAPGQPIASQIASVRWAPQTSWTDITDLETLGSRQQNAAHAPIDRFVFAATTVRWSGPGTAELSIGSERAYSVWLNGRPVYTREGTNTFAPDADRVPVELKEGGNLVVLRFRETSSGPSRFALRAVPAGTALRRIDEVSPSLVESADAGLAVRTHVTSESGAPVDLEVIAAGGKSVARKSAPRGEVVKFDSSGWRDGPYEIRASTADAWGKSSVRYLPWYKGDALAAARRIVAAAEQAAPGVEGDTVRMLAAMVKDRLGGSLDGASPDAWRKIHAPLTEFEELKAGSVRPGGFVRLVYADDVDGSTQFCRAYLPLHYKAGNASPLIMFLHGFNPANPEYIDWWSVDERHNAIADTRDVIVLEAHGRGNAQYLGIGDRDVLRCIDEAKRRFSVDADRVYLTGESMGGHGTWAIATRHPDVFAAAAPVYGGWDFRVTDVSGPATSPPPKTLLDAFSFERSSSFANAENLLHVPLLITHGDADQSVSVENSRHAVRMLQRWGYDVQYHEMPGWAHEDLGQRARIADWLLSHQRVNAPKSVRLRSTDLAGAAAYWVSVRAFENPAEVIRVNADVMRPGVVRVDSSNVAALTLNLPTSLRGAGDQVQVIWNGKPQQVRLKDTIAELGAPQSASGLHKRAGLEGPQPAVIATPFIVVVGTTSKDRRMREFIQARAEFLSQQWRSWQHQQLRMLKDTEVTREDEKAYSLILLGGADANAVTQRMKSKLPFSASRKGIVVDGREWPLADSVLQAIYPSPVAADRYVYVVAATSAEGMYFWKPQLVHFVQGFPLTMFDWVIQDGRRPPVGPMDAAASYVAAGVFDASWRRQDQWTRLRDPAALQWTLRHAPAPGFVPSAAALSKIAGSYEVFPGFAVSVRSEGTRVVVDVPGQPSLSMVPESEWVYLNPATGDFAEFVRDSQGNITGVAVENVGAVNLFKRL